MINSHLIITHSDTMQRMYRIAQKFDREKLRRIVRARNFDEQNFDELILGFIRIGKALTGKRVEGKTLTNRWPFVKFVKVSPHQTFALYGICLR